MTIFAKFYQELIITKHIVIPFKEHGIAVQQLCPHATEVVRPAILAPGSTKALENVVLKTLESDHVGVTNIQPVGSPAPVRRAGCAWPPPWSRPGC